MKYMIFFLTIMLLFLSCSKTATGPDIPEINMPALFCVLNPAQNAQQIQLQKAVTFQQATSGRIEEQGLFDADIRLFGPNGEMPVQRMGKLCASTPDSVHSDLDFLFGSGRFNYVVRSGAIKSSDRYRIEIDHPEHDQITAETTVPGAFEITQITDINLWDPETAADKSFSVQWTESENAAGYLIDITMLKYDLTPWRHFAQNEGELVLPWADSSGAYEVFDPPDSVDFTHLPFIEIPVDFDSLAEGLQRGILTQQCEFSLPVGDLLGLLNYPITTLIDEGGNLDIFDYISRYLCQIRVVIYAVDRALYDYTAFQYLNLGKDRIVGQQTVILDPSNIKNGIGVFGAATSRIEHSRILNRGLTPFMAYPNLSEAYKIVEKHGSSNAWGQIEPPSITMPVNHMIYDESETIKLSWSAIDSADFYLLVLKPQYLWFLPGNTAFFLQSTNIDIPASLFCLRDCRVEAYVKALRGNDFDFSDEYAFPVYRPGQGSQGWAGEFLYNNHIAINNIIQLPPEKADLLLNGFYSYEFSNLRFFFYISPENLKETRPYQVTQTHSLPRAATPWSESIFFHIQHGEQHGFEQQQPQAIAGLQWKPAEGADAYMVFINNTSGDWAATITRESSITPPFETLIESIEGTQSMSVASGDTLTWRVQALRVKTGGLGFAIEKEPGELPRVYPRYKHPSGIMLCSKWSEEQTYVVP